MSAIEDNDHEGDGQELPAEDAEATDVRAEAEQLDLDAGDEHLPWLESDEDYEEEGVDTVRIAVFAVIGLMVIALLVGGIWWMSRTHGSSAVADGSTIEAPKTPYKTKPAEPGGKTFEGTGDESFAVAEGQDRESRLATSPAAKPGVDAATPANTQATADEGVGVQVGAFSTRATAIEGWRKLVGQYAPLKGLKYRIVEGKADIGTVYRLQAVAPNLVAANSLCGKLKASGGACQVKP